MKKILIAALVILMCFAFIGCGGEEEEDVVLNPDADAENLTDTDWAKDIWNSAIQGLVDKGYAKRSEEEGILLQCMDSGMIDLSPEGRSLASEDFKIDGKVIWGSAHADRTENASLSIDTYSPGSEEEADQDIPHYASPYAVAPTKAEAFAKSRGRCKYLMLVTGLCYHIAKDYYFGPVDRKDVSTHVFVIDAVNKEVVYINHINSNVPGMSTTDPVGITYDEAARGVMNRLVQEAYQ